MTPPEQVALTVAIIIVMLLRGVFQSYMAKEEIEGGRTDEVSDK